MTPYRFRFAERASLALLALALRAGKPAKVAQIVHWRGGDPKVTRTAVGRGIDARP